jgi:hypothetical protein
MQLENVHIYCTTNPCLVSIYFHSAVTGGAWSSVQSTSCAEQNVTATSISGGHLADRFIVGTSGTGGSVRGTGSSESYGKIPCSLTITDAQTKGIVIFAQGLGGNSVVHAHMDWREIY